MTRPDPLADPAAAIARVYGYVGYRVGRGPDAEDITSECVERALRYRSSYDPSRGSPEAWLIGIARRCIDDWARRAHDHTITELPAPPIEIEEAVAERIDLARAFARLGDRDRDLLALRYGADLSVRRVAEVLGLNANAAGVALHRAVDRLRQQLDQQGPSVSP